ncbi:MAG: domain containing protein [Gemmatimonadetes bacterium]|nr:domain containing protein [Gemmatimonadota bacterium]
MTSCAFCGREHDSDSRFCIDCGKPLNPSAARVVPAYNPSSAGSPAEYAALAAQAARASAGAGGAMPHTRVSPQGGSPANCTKCGKPTDPTLPFCGHCGNKVTATASESSCPGCGAGITKGVDLFCARCGHRVGQRVSVQMTSPQVAGGTAVLGTVRRDAGPKLALLDDAGEPSQSYTLDRGEAVIGRGDADIKFEGDVYMSPLHARFDLRDGQLWLRDLGSRNGSWTFLDQPAKLGDGDLVLVGSQILRFRRLGYPGPHPPEADATRRMGSLLPSADVAVLEQLRADGSCRDSFHLSPGRSVVLGRETGDWLFPYDQTMSSKHAEIVSEDAEFFLQDAGSRNGVAMAVRGERALRRGQRVLIGDQILRVESV